MFWSSLRWKDTFDTLITLFRKFHFETIKTGSRALLYPSVGLSLLIYTVISKTMCVSAGTVCLLARHLLYYRSLAFRGVNILLYGGIIVCRSYSCGACTFISVNTKLQAMTDR